MKKFVLMFLIAIVVLSGCLSAEQSAPYTKASSKDFGALVITPLILSKKSFHSVVGWVNEKEILYVLQERDHFDIYSYHVLTGKTELIYTEKGQLTQADVSPSKESILLQQSNDESNAEVKVISLTTFEETWSEIIDSFELVFQWNPFDESKISFTAFEENWSYSVWFANMKNNTFQELNDIPPFHYWSSADEIIYQKWSSEQGLMSPLFKRSITSKAERLVKDQTFHFAISTDYLINVTIDETNQHFYYEVLKDETVVSSFNTPALHIYPDFKVPEYHPIQSKEQIIVIIPDAERAADSEGHAFNLKTIDLKTGRKTSIIKGINTMPLECSPEGTFCLAGHQLTSIVSIPKGELKQLFIFEEDIQ